MNKCIWRSALLATLLVTGLSTVRAEDESTANTIYPIELKADERIPDGRSAFIRGEADEKGHKFMLEGTDLSEPITITVLTQHDGEKVRVRIVKDNWDQPEKDQQTGDDRRADFRFRTFDGFKLWITADKPTPYQLIVWVGDKIELPPPSMAVPASEYPEVHPAGQQYPPDAADQRSANNPNAAGGGVSLSYLELGLIAALLLVMAAFAFFLMRRKA